MRMSPMIPTMMRTIFIAPPDEGGGLDPVNMGPAVVAGTTSALEGFPQAGQNLTPSPIGAPHALQNPAIVVSPPRKVAAILRAAWGCVKQLVQATRVRRTAVRRF